MPDPAPLGDPDAAGAPPDPAPLGDPDAAGALPDDLRAVVEEIREEAHRVRQSPDFPADLERQLDALFEDLVPERVDERDFEAVLDRAERASLIDIHAPIDDARPVFVHVKRGVRKLVLWYMDYVVRQLATFAGATTRAVRILGERVERLEDVHGSLVVPLSDAADELEGGRTPAPLDPELVNRIVDHLRGSDGRVLHVDAGDGRLVDALVEAGVDAYGVTARDGHGSHAGIRPQPPLDHLRTVGQAALGGLVMTGFVDEAPRATKLVAAGLAGEVLAAGGRLLLVASDPEAWEASAPPVVRDLAPGRPFHPDTWRALLERGGFVEVDVQPVEGAEGAGAGPAGTYLLTATRAR